MSWRSQYLDGSFRGAAFQVESHEHLLGRRAAFHEYPMRDLPYAEDLGRKGRSFKLELYVIGPNYMVGRDALRQALEAKGPGTLVHPYLGTHQVQLMGEAILRESLHEGGMARFSATFVEAGQLEVPTVDADTAAAVGDGVEAIKTVILEDETSTLDITGPEFVRIKLLDEITAAVDNISSIVARAGSTGVGVWLRQAKALMSSLSTLVSSPTAILLALFDLFLGVETDTDSATAFAAGIAYATGMEKLPSVEDTLWSTAERSKVRTNAQAVGEVAVVAAIAAAAQASSSMDFDSADDALAARDALTDALDAAALDATDAVYTALIDLRAAVVRDIGERAALLPSLTTYTPTTTLPGLVLAHKLYGDATREEEILARNRVRHPGAVAGDTPLEVLVDA